MGFLDRLSNGWKLSMSSFAVIKKHKQLLIFPVLSGASLLLLFASYLAILLLPNDGNFSAVIAERDIVTYIGLFVFYLINYFIVVFFNMGLIHCARIYFQGGVPKVSDGINFSLSRVGDILAWSAMAATVGLIFRLLEENLGKIGQIIAAFAGVAWSITTFFVVPVLAYENLTPIAAFKRSAQIMKEKWGESLGSSFSFGIVQILGILLIGLPLFFLGSLIGLIPSIVLAGIGVLFVIAVTSAGQTIFISAVYHRINDNDVQDFDGDLLDSAFIHKEKKGLF
ncbi:MAG: DUF6159 family protein [Chitinophagales bacterium]|jgi:hypothetical protein|nr:hypothetical protein [Bacteroidota bacterium]MBP8248820.1 hypothetical protein [Chitinophagales bacterium]MBP9879486.1 hypothetical protein [Chitinophagales bacterium]